MKPARLALVFGALCTAIALLAPIARYEGLPVADRVGVRAAFGVLLTDHFICAGDAEATAPVKGLNPPGLVA